MVEKVDARTDGVVRQFPVRAGEILPQGACQRISKIVAQITVGPDPLFKEVNMRNKMEGGPKGVAIHGSSLAICSPEHGIKIYSFREHVR